MLNFLRRPLLMNWRLHKIAIRAYAAPNFKFDRKFNTIKPVMLNVTDESEQLYTGGMNEDVSGPIRWGVAPVCTNANEFAMALKLLPRDRHQLVACAAAYRTHANAFARKHHVPNVYSSFEDLAKSDDIDVVYISPLNPLHHEMCSLMQEHGKNVLCEKPLCMNSDQVKDVISKSIDKRIFLMEGMWSRFLPAYEYLREQLDSGALGRVYEVNCSLGLPVKKPDFISYHSVNDPSCGVTCEFGIYGIQLALYVFRNIPFKIKACGKVNEDGYDTEAEIEINFGSGRITRISLSSERTMLNKAVITGTGGKIELPNYWCPTGVFDVDGKQKKFPLPEFSDWKGFRNPTALCYEAEEVRRCLLSNQLESNFFNHSESILVSQIIDEIRKQLGTTCDDDKFAEHFLEY